MIDFFNISENPVFDLHFFNLYIASKILLLLNFTSFGIFIIRYFD